MPECIVLKNNYTRLFLSFTADDDNCANVTCENGGTCNDLFDEGYECNCAPGFTGEHCESVIPTDPPPTTTTTQSATTTRDPDWCSYCRK